MSEPEKQPPFETTWQELGFDRRFPGIAAISMVAVRGAELYDSLCEVQFECYYGEVVTTNQSGNRTVKSDPLAYAALNWATAQFNIFEAFYRSIDALLEQGTSLATAVQTTHDELMETIGTYDETIVSQFTTLQLKSLVGDLHDGYLLGADQHFSVTPTAEAA